MVASHDVIDNLISSALLQVVFEVVNQAYALLHLFAIVV